MPANLYGSKWLWPATRLAIYMRDNFRCVYCARSLKNRKPRDVTVDHVSPRCNGMDNRPCNLVTACRRCNDAKGNQDVVHWLRERPDARARLTRQLAMPLNRELARDIIAGRLEHPCVRVRRAVAD